MILDQFKAFSLTFQIQHENAYLIWDRAGTIATRLCKIWPGLKFREGLPNQQVFVADRAVIQTGLDKSTITLSGDKVFEQQRVMQIKDTFQVWRELLEFRTLARVSTRVQYLRKFSTLKEANQELLALNLARQPSQRVFDQPSDAEKNGLTISYRFEDDSSFSFLSVRTEQAKVEVELDPELFDEPNLTKTQQRLVLDFDRGLLGTVNADKFMVDEWLKGYQHLLRRDIEKVIAK
jgi:hypothetical protein